MGGLTQENLRILASYAKAGNRELYWNYLSQLPDADGYGTLALGVVRNDSLPGRVANSYAQDYARHQEGKGSGFPDTQLSANGRCLGRRFCARTWSDACTGWSRGVPNWH